MLDAVAKIQRTEAPTEVDHYQLRRMIDVFVAPKSEALGGVANEIDRIIADTHPPEGTHCDDARHGAGDALLVPVIRPGPDSGRRARLSDPRRAVPLVRRSVSHPAGRAAGYDRGADHAGCLGHHAQHHVADGGGDDGRHRRLQQHPDRRIHAPADRGGNGRAQGGRHAVPGPPAAHADDLAGDAHRADPDGAEAGRRERVLRAAGARDHRRAGGERGADGIHRAGGISAGLRAARWPPGHTGAGSDARAGAGCMKRALLLALGFLTAAMGGILRAADSVQPVSPPAAFAILPALPERLTLSQAEDYALAHQPALAASRLRAEAEIQRVDEARSQFFPQIQGEAVLVKARDDDSRLAATGGISNPTILSRQSDGAMLSQLITDFGRTYFLTTSARSSAVSAAERAEEARESLLLRVDQAYFAVQGAQALLQVAGQTVSTNQVLLDRVKALAGANLKSSLDVSFQQVNIAQAKLLRIQAAGRLDEAFADLSAALGLGGKVEFTLAPIDLDPMPATDAGPLIAQAWAHRPDLLAARADREAAVRFAKAEVAARFPTVSAQGGVGINPGTVNKDLPPDYAAIGLNVSVPVFTGGMLTARGREAALRAQAAQQDLAAQETDAARDVYNAWTEAKTAYEGIAVSQELLDAAQQAFELARSRYQVGASSIVELSEADLQEIQAEITAATSRYDYQVRRRALDYQVGSLK